MRELIINGLSWCAYHGRPIVSIRPVDAAWCFWLTLAPDDAEAMAGDREMTSRCASRAYQLVEALGHSLRAEIRETRLDIDASKPGPIVGTLIVDQKSGERHQVPITAADAVIIAWRSLCPLLATDAAIEHIQGALGIERAGADGTGQQADQLSTPIRQFIESLDFGGPDGPIAHPQETPVNARPVPHVQDAEPAQRFLTDLDRRLGPSAASIATWPATVLFWQSQSTRLVRKLRDRHQGANTRVQTGTQRGQAG